MDNPFQRRATELLDDEAFLAIVSPEPVRYYLREKGQTGGLYDRLVRITGTPGSGKTTLARLFVFPTLAALLRNRQMSAHQALMATLSDCHAIEGGDPAIIGCRLPLETDYRDFWEFDYPPELKLGLMTALLQSRAVLSWVRSLAEAGADLANVTIVPRKDAEAATARIGGTRAADVVQRARAVELSIYDIVGALLAPDISQIDSTSTDAYRPFDVIDRIQVQLDTPSGHKTWSLRPLVVLDDAHSLHPAQFRALQQWLIRRELRVSRWVLTRLDVLHPHEALAAAIKDRESLVDLPGITASRDTTEIMLQSDLGDRSKQRDTSAC